MTTRHEMHRPHPRPALTATCQELVSARRGHAIITLPKGAASVTRAMCSSVVASQIRRLVAAGRAIATAGTVRVWSIVVPRPRPLHLGTTAAHTDAGSPAPSRPLPRPIHDGLQRSLVLCGRVT